MTIHLPNDVERSIEAFVQKGRFASVDEAMTKAAHLLLQELNREAKPATGADTAEIVDPLLGSMGDHAELMDQIVEDAMRHREQQPWRLSASE
jgi:Arc/MetJ-type ribon-helix-helix transcriptional regulator